MQPIRDLDADFTDYQAIAVSRAGWSVTRAKAVYRNVAEPWDALRNAVALQRFRMN